MKRIVDKVAAEREPSLIWNAFIDLIAVEGYEDLTPTQRKAHLVFWYESEVQNGGHGQYLENQGVARLGETVSALHELELSCQGRVLKRIAQLFAAAPQGTAWEAIVGDEAIDHLDAEFHACRPEVNWGLERHLGLHLQEYVSLV